MALHLKVDTVSKFKEKYVAYIQIVDDAGGVVSAFDTYYDPADRAGFTDYCDRRLREEEARVDDVASVKDEISGLMESVVAARADTAEGEKA